MPKQNDITSQVWEQLYKRYPTNEYAILREVRDAAGFHASRSADGVVVNLWPSRGCELIGLEVKVSRTDWLKELKQPDKAENIFQYCDRWYLVTGMEDIVRDGELPVTWGWMTLNAKGKLVTMKEPPKLDPVPLTKTFVASLMKRVTQGMIHFSQIDEKVEALSENKHDRYKRDAEGIRAQESPARAKKEPLSIRKTITSTFYRGMSVAEALEAYRPDKRLALNWYPIFNMTIEEVWGTYGMSVDLLHEARDIYKTTGKVPHWWTFHPAYPYGNDRVSCMICILGSMNDIQNGISHNPSLHTEMASMEMESGFIFRPGLALNKL